MKSLYLTAENEQIEICHIPIHLCGSISMPGYIALDYDLRGADERVHLAHELGHCETGSFYNRCSPQDIIEKHEVRADRWAIKKLVPENELDMAVKAGYVELWELAERFEVTEDFMLKAIDYYKQLKGCKK